MRPRACFALLTGMLLHAAVAEAARPVALGVRRVDLNLPGPPSAIVAADLNGDGRRDLLVIVAYTRWGSITSDRVEDAIAVTQVVPALFDVREARAFLAEPGGAYRSVGPPLSLPVSVLSAEAGPPAHPVIAVTDDGLSEIRWDQTPGAESLTLEPLIAEPSAFAGSGAFLPELSVIKDVDGDGVADAVIPAQDGIAVHRGESGGFSETAAFRGRLPGDEPSGWLGSATRRVPIPRVEDADGDGHLDLVVSGLDETPAWLAIARGLGGARFSAPIILDLSGLAASGKAPSSDRRVAWSGDLDGDGRIEFVTRETIDTGKSDMKQVKRPLMRYQLHHLKPDRTVDPQPYTTFDAEGWAFSGGFRDGIDLRFIDLDGDGRKDLVTVTLDFSMLQALRALTVKKIGVGLEFHVIAQRADGSFRLVPDQKLEETLHLDLDRLEISRLGQFRGDFDGDGRIDFVHLGRGKNVTIHRGQPGGKYPDKPDLTIALDEEPEDALLVRVRDFDGDGRSDLAITRTLAATESGATPTAQLTLELSGDGR